MGKKEASNDRGCVMKAVVLHGEVPEGAGRDEQDVLVQAGHVSRSLAEQGYKPTVLAVSANFSRLIDQLNILQPDFAFNLVESILGQGRLIHMTPSILDCLNIPYTGARTEAIFVTSQKLLAKRYLQMRGLDTPPWISPDESHANPFTPGSYVIKSVWEHASVGLDEDSIVSVQNEKKLHKIMKSKRDRLGGACFAEAFIAGREFNLSLLAGPDGPEVLPPAEIRFDDYPPGKHRVVGYRAKWDEDSFEYQNTPRAFEFPAEDALLLEKLKKMSLECWQIFDLKGYARVDFRVDQEGRPWILEINTNPCLSPDAGFHAAAERAGLKTNGIIERIVNDTC
ncbi:MAG: D-alanine--D-alanine ligase [Pseudomonadota bacterium]